MNRPSKSCELDIRVTPRSSSNTVSVESGLVKIKVTSPPVDGEANEATRSVLAMALGIAKSKVQIIRGATSREKRVAIEGLDLAQAMNLLGGATLF